MNAERVEAILEKLNEGLVEREEVVSMTLLAVLSGQSVFLYGPPGTAKSMIASKISSVFEDARYFEYLMQRFSTPEDVFGPISISELRNDNYVRMTGGFLPEADLAFLDEIWKSSPAILNTLLTIINEHKFRNGTSVTEVPLKAVVAASNEFPKENSGLDALYDRLLVRLIVSPVRTKRGFDRMITGGKADSAATMVDPITFDEWFRVRTLSENIGVSKEALKAIDEIRKRIDRFNRDAKGKRIYVSDRRWVNSVALLRAASYIAGKKEVTLDECPLLKYCIWSSEEEYQVTENIVRESIQSVYYNDVKELAEWKSEFRKLENEIQKGLEADERRPLPGFSKVNVSRTPEGDTLRLELDDTLVYMPSSYLKGNRGFDLPVKDMRTGKSSTSHFFTYVRDANTCIINMDGEGYMLTMSDINAPTKNSLGMKRSLLDIKDEELTRISGSIAKRYQGTDYEGSPFLSDDDNRMIADLKEGKSSEIQDYHKRISELRGLLDARS